MDEFSHREMIRMAVDHLVPFIQLRAKQLAKEEIVSIAKWAMEELDWTHSKLIINDHIDVAQKSGAHGVHLGQLDDSVQEARLMLGPDATIGGTANTADEALALIAQGVDYIGLGPYRFTATKQNLSPVLGLQGVQSVVEAIRATALNTPVFVIGGIVLEDVESILARGASGVAIASAINRMADPHQAIGDFQNKLAALKTTEIYE